MSSINRHKSILKQWGLSKIPFKDVPPSDPDILARVFHGREREIDRILPALYEGRNVLVRGAWGIGKTALIYKALDQLGREVTDEGEQLLIIYLSGIPSLSPQDFYRAVLLAVTSQLSEYDEMARSVYESLTGIYTQTSKTTLEGKVTLAFISLGAKQESSGDQFSVKSSSDPYSLLINMLQLAENYHTGIVLAIDDLDKQEVPELHKIIESSLDLFRMGDRRAFLLTGRGFTELQEVTLRALGIFAEDLSLSPMTVDELRQIAINYLNIGRAEPMNTTAPFSEEVINLIAEYAQGSPRQLNYICYKIMTLAIQDNQVDIGGDEFKDLWSRVQAEAMLSLTPHLRWLLYIAYQTGGISEDITNDQLDQAGVLTFVELLPILRTLEEQEFLLRKEDSSGFRYVPSKLFLPPE